MRLELVRLQAELGSYPRDIVRDHRLRDIDVGGHGADDIQLPV
jgi:hypothetical protein